MESQRTRDLQGDNNSPAPAKLFPQWREVEQDFWLDRFESITDLLLDQFEMPEMEESASGDHPAVPSDDWYVSRVQLAAKLADEATKEMIYRIERQKPVKHHSPRPKPRGDRGGQKKVRRLW